MAIASDFLFHWKLLNVFVYYEISKLKANRSYLRVSKRLARLEAEKWEKGKVSRVVFCLIHTPPNQIGEQKHEKKVSS